MLATTSPRTKVFGKGIKVHSGISCQGRHFVRGTKTSTPAPPGHRPAHEQVIAKPSSARSSLNQTEKLKPGHSRREIRAGNICVDKGTRMKRPIYPALRSSTVAREHQITNEAFDRHGKGRRSVTVSKMFAARHGLVLAQPGYHGAQKAPRRIGNTSASAIGKGGAGNRPRSLLSFS
jgi:hypothetical protein